MTERMPLLQRQALSTLAPSKPANLLESRADGDEQDWSKLRYSPIQLSKPRSGTFELLATRKCDLPYLRQVIGKQGSKSGDGATGLFGLAPEPRKLQVRSLVSQIDFCLFPDAEARELATHLTKLVMSTGPDPIALADFVESSVYWARDEPRAFDTIWTPVHHLPPELRAKAIKTAAYARSKLSFASGDQHVSAWFERSQRTHLTAWHELAAWNPDEIKEHLPVIDSGQQSWIRRLEQLGQPASPAFKQKANRSIAALFEKVSAS